MIAKISAEGLIRAVSIAGSVGLLILIGMCWGMTNIPPAEGTVRWGERFTPSDIEFRFNDGTIAGEEWWNGSSQEEEVVADRGFLPQEE